MAVERDDTAMAFPAFRSGSFATDPTDPGGELSLESPAPVACPDENTLVLLAEGVLDGDERAAIDRHLDTCAACSMLVAELARLAEPAPRAAPQRYKVIRQLGAGAMGVVWEAEDTSLQRKVALKFVKPEGADDRGLRKRLLREARALAQVRHPNVMALYDAGEADDEVCLVLELITGTNARVWRETTPRSVAEIVAVWKQAAAGIAAVHKAGIVHRDIKPDNVFVSADGRVLVGDFGLATGDGVNSTTSLTISGAVIGTPLYMSPEQLQGKTASTLSDQFALCASIWEGIVGERPFRGSTIAAVVLAMSKLPEIPKTVDPEQRRVLAILQRGLDPDPSKRFADVAELLSELEALDRPAKKRRGWLWFSGALVLAVGGTVAVLAATRGSNAVAQEPASPGSATPAPQPAPPKPQAAVPAPPVQPPVQPPQPAQPTQPTPAVTKQAPIPPVAKAPPSTTAPGTTAPGTTIKDPAVKTTEPVAIREDLSFTHLMQRASDKLNYGDGAGCLKLLEQLPDVPDDQMIGVELVKIECRMASGDCGGAEAAMKAYGAKLGWDEGRIKSFYEGADQSYCPLEAQPKTRWGARAQYRLTVAASRGGSCKTIQDAIKRNTIALPDPKSAAFMDIQCHVNVGECAVAKQKYLDLLIAPTTDPKARPQIEESLAKSFHTSYKKCPP